MWFLTLTVIYVFIIFFILRLLVPYMGFGKTKIPKEIPDDLSDTIKDLNKNSTSDLDYLQNAYKYVTSKYYGSRFQTITKFWYAYKNVFNYKSGFLPCNGQNYLLSIILIKSGRFDAKDIKTRTVPLNFIIHQYLEVRVDDNWVNVDPWSKSLGKSFGQRAFLFV